MAQPAAVWPSTNFWLFQLALATISFFVLSWTFAFPPGLISLPGSILLYSEVIIFSLIVVLGVLGVHYMIEEDQATNDRLFHGYERKGKIIGAILLFVENIGMYYYTIKSVECMLLFLCLGYFSLCNQLLLQPRTSFGILEFFLTGSLNQALGLYGLRNVISWLVLIACVFIASLTYMLERQAQPSNLPTHRP